MNARTGTKVSPSRAQGIEEGRQKAEDTNLVRNVMIISLRTCVPARLGRGGAVGVLLEEPLADPEALDELCPPLDHLLLPLRPPLRLGVLLSLPGGLRVARKKSIWYTSLVRWFVRGGVYGMSQR